MHKENFISVALDPIHFGAGGYRIGRVDNAIVREPGTNLPKGPATTLKGCIKFCADTVLREKLPRNQSVTELKSCGGTQGCGLDHCPICYTFGYSSETDNFEGSVNIYDAHITLFPVYSDQRSKWITTEKILKKVFDITVASTDSSSTDSSEEKAIVASSSITDTCNPIRLGWMFLPKKEKKLILPTSPAEWNILKGSYADITGHIVIVEDKIFGHLINSNLEVRTSNAIDPETGAVDPEARALFTYESLPRTTVLAFDMVLNSYRQPLATKIAKLGMYYLRFYGLGGMTSRGFGRLDVLGTAGLTTKLTGEIDNFINSVIC